MGDAGRRCGFEAGALALPPGVIAFAGAPSRKPVSFDGASSSDSGSPSVLVDEAAEDVTTFDVAEWVAGEGRSWCLESDAPMASCVVVVHVSAERVLQVAMGEDQQVIEALGTHRLHPAFGKCIRTRRPDRCADGPDAIGSGHFVEAGGELGIAVPDQETDSAFRLLQIPDEVPGHLGHPLPVWIRRDTKEVHDSALDRDDEQGVVALNIHGVDVEEVSGQHAAGLRVEEFRPGWSFPAGSGRKPVVTKYFVHTCRGRGHAELAQLAYDPQVAPPGILPCQSTDQLDVAVG